MMAWRKGIFSGTAVALALVGGAAKADQATTQAAGVYLEEITVTARQRRESLMDVPVAVNVFTARVIEEAGIERADDYLALVPNVSFVQAQDAGTHFIAIRGLTQVRNSESPVAVVVDGVLLANPIQFTQELFDIEQIEVLKGPQGALYGRNAIGGAITITTRQPTNDFEGWLRVGGGNGDRVKAQGSVSGPVVKDKLLFRVAASHLEYDGYLDNLFLNEPADFYQDRTGRILLKWLASDNFTADFRASASKTEGGALYYVINSDIFTGGPDAIGDPNDTSVPITSNIRGLDDRELYDMSLKLDWTTPFGTLSSISAWSKSKERSGGDNAPYLPSTIEGTQDGTMDVKGLSQELRFTSPGDQRLRYIVGGYVLKTDRSLILTSGLDLGPGILKPGINPPDDPVNPTVFAFWDDNDNTAWALFGQVNFDITEQLELSGAIRYDRDEREQEDLSPFTGTRGLVREADFSKWQPKVSLSYRPSDSFTLFANYSEGFRSGGFNQPGVAAVAAAQVPPVRGVSDIYDKETSRGFEIGLKSMFLDNRLSFNAAAFMTEVKGQHYFSYIPQIGAQIITSIDKVDLWGFELEAMLRIADGLQLFSAFGYTDSEIKEYSVDPTAVGNMAPYVPEYTFQAGFQYRQPIMGDLSLLARMDYNRRGKLHWEPNNLTRNDPINLVRARLGIENEEHGWSLVAWSENLFNEKYNADFVLGGFAFRAQPRTYGIDFTKRF